MLAGLVIAGLALGMAPPPPPPPPVGCDPIMIHFEAGSARIGATGTWVIGNIVSVKDQIRSRMKLTGHADESDGEGDVVALSRRRAEAVKDALVSEGVPERVIIVQARGRDLPLDKRGIPEANAANRRVEVCFY